MQRGQGSASSSYSLEVTTAGKEDDCPAIPHNRSRTHECDTVHGTWPRMRDGLCWAEEAIDHGSGATESALALAKDRKRTSIPVISERIGRAASKLKFDSDSFTEFCGKKLQGAWSTFTRSRTGAWPLRVLGPSSTPNSSRRDVACRNDPRSSEDLGNPALIRGTQTGSREPRSNTRTASLNVLSGPCSVPPGSHSKRRAKSEPAGRPAGSPAFSLQKLQKLQQQRRTIRRRRVDSYSASKDTMQSASSPHR